MPYVVLARRYRPQTFDEVVAQPHVTATLKNAIASGRVAHALCLSGPRGTGKTTVARVFAKAMNCEKGPTDTPCNTCASCKEITAGASVDVFEIDGASNNTVDQVRDLRDNVAYAPARSRYKIYIIDEVHMLSTAAFNALLKTLEEPPPHVLFVLATTEVNKIPVTILSRCQRHDFARIGTDQIVAHLRFLCGKESFEIPDDSLWTIARKGGGCMRDSLSLLDQIMACCPSKASDEDVRETLGVLDQRTVFALAAALLGQDVAGCLEAVNTLYAQGQDIKRLLDELVDHFRNAVVVKSVKNPEPLLDIPASEVAAYREEVRSAPLSLIRQVLHLLSAEEAAIRVSSQPKLSLEVACIRICEITPALTVDAVLEKLDRLQQSLGAPGPDCVAAPKAPGPAPVVPAKPEPSPALDGLSPEALWEALLAHVEKGDPQIAGCLAKCSLKKMEGGVLEIEAPADSLSWHQLSKKEHSKKLEEAWSRFFQKSISVHITEAKAGPRTGPRETAQERRAAVEEVARHPRVTDAMELFGGHVTEVKKL